MEIKGIEVNSEVINSQIYLEVTSEKLPCMYYDDDGYIDSESTL